MWNETPIKVLRYSFPHVNSQNQPEYYDFANVTVRDGEVTSVKMADHNLSAKDLYLLEQLLVKLRGNGFKLSYTPREESK